MCCVVVNFESSRTVVLIGLVHQGYTKMQNQVLPSKVNYTLGGELSEVISKILLSYNLLYFCFIHQASLLKQVLVWQQHQQSTHGEKKYCIPEMIQGYTEKFY